MLNITIQNSGRTEIQSVCAGAKEMRYNANLLLALASSMETVEAVAKKEANDISVQTTYYLYLDKVENNNKLSTVRALSQQLNMPIERAKAIIDTAAADRHTNVLLSQSPDESYINTMKDALESAGCICEITKG